MTPPRGDNRYEGRFEGSGGPRNPPRAINPDYARDRRDASYEREAFVGREGERMPSRGYGPGGGGRGRRPGGGGEGSGKPEIGRAHV